MVRVLLAEDVGAISIALEDALADAGYTVVGSFASGGKALEWLNSNHPDMAVLDAVLNDGICVDLARALRSRAVPFLFLSANPPNHGMPGDLGDVPWLEKPITYDRLLEGLEALRSGLTSNAAPLPL